MKTETFYVLKHTSGRYFTEFGYRLNGDKVHKVEHSCDVIDRRSVHCNSLLDDIQEFFNYWKARGHLLDYRVIEVTVQTTERYV